MRWDRLWARRKGGQPLTPITLVQVPPLDVDEAFASAMLSVTKEQFRKLVRLYPDKLRPHNLLSKGDRRWTYRQLQEFVEWREMIGVESA